MEERTLTTQTVVHAWGYGPASLPLFREYGGSTPAARATAIAHGWDPIREGGWAIEMMLPARADLASMALEAEAKRDPAVVGWSIIVAAP
jgi:hypothetical protein